MFRLAALAVSLSALPGLAAEPFALTGENCKITFVGTKPSGKHEGGFKEVAGTATAVAGDPSALKVELTIDAASIYSDNAKLTGHLMSPDFFSVKEFPKLIFKLTKVEKTAEGYTQTGELTMLGRTKPVTLPSTITSTESELTIVSDFSVKRSEWGMTYGMGKVDDEVKLKVEVKAKR